MINQNFVILGAIIAAAGSLSYLIDTLKGKLTGFDLMCGALSIVGLVLWYITKSGDIAIIFSILADGLAALPTVVKSFNYPETESAWPYFASTISGILTLLTIKVWNLANIGFPLYIVLITLVIFSLVQFKLGKQIRLMLGTTA